MSQLGRWVDGAREEEDISEMKEGPSKHISKHMKPPWIYCELPFTPLQGSLPPFKNSLLMSLCLLSPYKKNRGKQKKCDQNVVTSIKVQSPLRRGLNLMDLMDIPEWRFKGERSSFSCEFFARIFFGAVSCDF